jgi:hypothetical protein
MGDAARADVGKIETIWAPIERLSLAERYSAASQAGTSLSKRTIRREVLGFSPRQMRAAEADDDAALFEQALQLQTQQTGTQVNPATGQATPLPQRQQSVAA